MMENWTSTIWCCGISEQLEQVLTVVSIMMGGTEYSAFINIFAAISLLFVMFKLRKEQGIGLLGEWAARYIIIMSFFLVWKMDIEIKDTAKSENLTVASVENFPAIIGIPTCVLTGLMRSITYKIESICSMLSFGDTGSWERYGSTFNARIIANSRHIRPTDFLFIRNMEEFCLKCVLREAWIGKRYTMEELKNTSNIWALVSAAPNQELAMLWHSQKTTGRGSRATTTYDKNVVGCDKAARNLTAEMTTNSGNWFSRFAKGLFRNEVDESTANKFLDSYLSHSLNAGLIMKSSLKAQDRLQQAMLVNLFKTAIDKKQTSMGLQGVYPETRASLELMNTGALKWSLVSEFLSLTQQILLCAFIFFSPFLLIGMALTNNIGVIAKGFLEALFWILLWEPVFCFLDIFMIKSQWLGEYTISNSMTQITNAEKMQAIAGFLSVFIGTLSFYIAKWGRYAAVSLASGIGSAIAAHSATSAREMTDGNMSLGNVSSGVVNTNLRRSNKFDTNGEVLSGEFLTNRADGSRAKFTQDKTSITIGGPGMNLSKTGVDINLQKGLQGHARVGLRTAQSKVANDVHTMDSRLGNLTKALGSLATVNSKGESSGENYDISNTAGNKESYDEMQTHGDRISKLYHVNREVGFKAAAALAAGVGVKGVAGYLSNQGGGIQGNAHADARLTGDAHVSGGSGSKDEELASIANDIRHSKATDIVEQAANRDSYSTTDSEGKTFSHSFQADVDSAKTASDNLSVSSQDLVEAQQNYEIATNSGIVMNQNVTDRFIQSVAQTAAPNMGGQIIGMEQAQLMVQRGGEELQPYIEAFMAKEGKSIIQSQTAAMEKAQSQGHQRINDVSTTIANKKAALQKPPEHTIEGLQQKAHEQGIKSSSIDRSLPGKVGEKQVEAIEKILANKYQMATGEFSQELGKTSEKLKNQPFRWLSGGGDQIKIKGK